MAYSYFSAPCLPPRRRFSLYLRLLGLLLALLPLAVRAQAPAPSVGTILNPDGTVRAGTQGSFDATGYELSYGPGGEPLLWPAGTMAPGWNAVGAPGAPNGVSGSIHALAVSGTDVYVGGSFSQAGGIAANRVAKWNGTSWSSLGTGLANGVNDAVFALVVSGPDVYVGGYFTRAGVVAANRVAKWNGTSWSSLGIGAANGVNAFVNALAVSGPDVYVGGSFTQAGGVAANQVAKWNGTAWSSLGMGITNGVGGIVNVSVRALAVSGADVYVGGTFSQAGGIVANSVAKWNGTSWSSLGTGPANGVDVGSGISNVLALAVSGTDVYVGGFFDRAGGIAANNVAYYTPSVLSAVPAARTLTSLTLAPNPTAGLVRLTGAVAGAPVQVFNALGRLVLRATATAAGTAVLTLPAELARGLYVVRTGAQAKRLVLE